MFLYNYNNIDRKVHLLAIDGILGTRNHNNITIYNNISSRGVSRSLINFIYDVCQRITQQPTFLYEIEHRVGPII